MIISNAKLVLIFVISTLVMINSGNLVFAQEFPDYDLKVETVEENLEVPWAIAFSPDGRIFVTERAGKLRVIEDGNLRPEPMTIMNVGHAEGGLLGLALDQKIEKNHHIYLYYTYSEFL